MRKQVISVVGFASLLLIGGQSVSASQDSSLVLGHSFGNNGPVFEELLVVPLESEEERTYRDYFGLYVISDVDTARADAFLERRKENVGFARTGFSADTEGFSAVILGGGVVVPALHQSNIFADINVYVGTDLILTGNLSWQKTFGEYGFGMDLVGYDGFNDNPFYTGFKGSVSFFGDTSLILSLGYRLDAGCEGGAKVSFSF